ncbi:ABC transporter permease [Paenochrobactrum pullorum]|uniref:ABC transporter permease n=1 Tax=Paenochrobactrum pullorum TaxID=1324351 RepID=UPI0035BC7892
MVHYFLSKLLEALVAVWGVLTIVFFVTRILGDPAALLLPTGASAQELDALRVQLGLNQPVLDQYLHYLLQILHGDFGVSFQFQRPALEVVMERMPATLELAFAAILFGTLFGVIAGTIAALNRGKLAELIVMVFALLGQATPVFWLGIMFVLLFAVELGILPTGGRGTLAHTVLPAMTLAIFVCASIARLLRSSLLDVLREDYVRTARAKGLMPRTILIWHVARNALIPVVTMIGIIMGELLGGSVVTETVFAWPGIGRLIIQAIETKDFPVIQAGVMLIAFIFVAINLLIDLAYGFLDPRIRERR